MGAKTALLAFSDGDLRSALISESPSFRTEAERLVHAVHPGREVTPSEDEFLTRLSYPPADRTYARVLAGDSFLTGHQNCRSTH
jgi:hypothetical protein